MEIFLRKAFFIALFTACVGCGIVETETSTAGPTLEARSATNAPGFKSQVVLSEQMVSDFGWLRDGRVYYGIEYGDKSNWPYVSVDDITTTWFIYDPLNGTTNETQSPYPTASPAMYQAITQNGMIELMAMNVSPSGETVLYTHLPHDFKGVSPGTPAHGYIPPIELWIARDQGREEILLNARFSYECGMLNPTSQWLESETLVVGSCQQFYGLPAFFIADLVNHKVHLISYETENGDLNYPSGVAAAHKIPLLAVENWGLWIMTIDVVCSKFPAKLDRTALYVNGNVNSFLWSSDDRWVYYWRWGHVSSYDETTGNPQYPWRLERINVATRLSEIILDETDLRSTLGDALYEVQMNGGIIDWRLSSDERKALLFIADTLFLISW